MHRIAGDLRERISRSDGSSSTEAGTKKKDESLQHSLNHGIFELL